MKIVYDAYNALDAHVVRNLLETEGIPSFVQGEYLQGGVGELSAIDLVKVAVNDHDAIRARALIEAWESSQPMDKEAGNEDRLRGSENSVTPIFHFISGFIAGGLSVWLYLQFNS